ncbi:MAG: urease accessory protein UreE [Paracoccaceae bacterium]
MPADAPSGPLRLGAPVARADTPGIADRLHNIGHAGRVERLVLAPEDAGRARLRAVTDAGTDCGLALPRGTRLADGDVLLLEPTRAIVVRLGAERWLRLAPRDAAAALALGHRAGHLHWRVRFDGAVLAVAVEGSREDLLARIADLVDDEAVVALAERER